MSESVPPQSTNSMWTGKEIIFAYLLGNPYQECPVYVLGFSWLCCRAPFMGLFLVLLETKKFAFSTSRLSLVIGASRNYQ